MATFQAFTLAYHLVAMVTCSALAILVLSQLRRDRTSRIFALLMGSVALIAFFGTMSRLANTLQLGKGWVDTFFTGATLFTAPLPALVFIFSTELLQAWVKWRRRVALVLVTVAILADIAFILGFGFVHFAMDPEGYVTYQLTPFINILLAFGEAGILLTLHFAFGQYRQRQTRVNNRLLIGMAIMCFGYLLIALPSANKWVPQIGFFSLSGVVIVGPILQQRLFDPLTQLNVKLTRRAEQLSIITRVGQQATSLLALNGLLDVIVQEIQRAFEYYAVTIYLFSDKDKTLEAKAAAGIAAQDFLATSLRLPADETSVVGATAKSRQLVNAIKVREDVRYAQQKLRPNTQAEISLPLMVGSSTLGESLIGVLDIQSERVNAFAPEDLEVLQILGNQIAIAIRNAQLFEETQQARLLADKASRLKTQFLSEMSHELRTPLQTVITRSQWMLKHPEMYGGITLPVEYQADLSNIEKSGKHLHSLINNILDLSKIEAGEFELNMSPTDPLPLLRDVIQTYTGSLHPGVQIRSLYPEALPYIWGDDVNLKKILGNLVGNACKFTEHGTITLEARVESDVLRFSVADTGPGLSLEAQAKLFRAYSQVSKTARGHEGTGLGLYVCKQLVELHGGKIWCDSMVGQGSAFYFTIPLASSENKEASAQTTSARVVVFPKKDKKVLPIQILLVDSVQATREQVELVLARSNFEVITAATGSDAQKLSAALTPSVVVIVLHPDSPSEILDLSEQMGKETMLPNTQVIKLRAEGEPSTWQAVVLEQLPTVSNLVEILKS